MSITFDALQQLVKREGLYYFVRPDLSQLIGGVAGMFGKYQLMMSLVDDGTFLQIRSFDNPCCPADHAHVARVLALLGELNSQHRFVKFGWDPTNGEIAAFADHWIMDNTLTQQQLNRMLGNYLPVVDMGYHRAKKIIETGQDPGQLGPDSHPGSDSGIPPALRALMERVSAESGGSDEDIDEL